MRKAYIVDSSEYWAGLLRAYLHRFEIDVMAWHQKGSGWLEAMARDVPHYLFIEDQLPSRSGLACVDKIDDVLKLSVKIVFQHSLQGLVANQVEAQAFARGAHHVLRKPYQMSEIRKLVLDF